VARHCKAGFLQCPPGKSGTRDLLASYGDADISPRAEEGKINLLTHQLEIWPKSQRREAIYRGGGRSSEARRKQGEAAGDRPGGGLLSKPDVTEAIPSKPSLFYRQVEGTRYITMTLYAL
jgi:hypothetical protein